MELVTIFVDENNEGLYAVRYKEGEQDEYERLFDNWVDPNYTMSYLIFNDKYLKDSYFQYTTKDELVDKIYDEATKMSSDFKNTKPQQLQRLFKPLSQSDK